MWNIFWSCVWLRCKWWIKRPIELILLFSIVPITMLLLVSLTQSVTNHEGIQVAIVDEDQSNYSQIVIEQIYEKRFISIEEVVDREQATRLLETNRVEAVIIFSKGFQNNLVHEKKKEIIEMLVSPASIADGLLSEVISTEVLRLSSNDMAAHYITNKYEQLHLLSASDRSVIDEGRFKTSIWQEAWDHSDSYWEPEPLMSIVFLEKSETISDGDDEDHVRDQLEWVRYELQLLMGYFTILILFILIFAQQWVVEEKINGIQKRIESMGVSSFYYMIGHSFPALVFVIIQGMVTTLFVYGAYDFVIPLRWGQILLIFLYIVAAFSLSLCIAIWVRTLGQLQVIGIFLILLTSVMGGSFIDLGEFVNLANWTSYATPQGWFLHGWKEGSIWPSVLSLTGFISLFTLLSVGGWQKSL